jgi:hypothetical protein
LCIRGDHLGPILACLRPQDSMRMAAPPTSSWWRSGTTATLAYPLCRLLLAVICCLLFAVICCLLFAVVCCLSAPRPSQDAFPVRGHRYGAR